MMKQQTDKSWYNWNDRNEFYTVINSQNFSWTLSQQYFSARSGLEAKNPECTKQSCWPRDRILLDFLNHFQIFSNMSKFKNKIKAEDNRSPIIGLSGKMLTCYPARIHTPSTSECVCMVVYSVTYTVHLVFLTHAIVTSILTINDKGNVDDFWVVILQHC